MAIDPTVGAILVGFFTLVGVVGVAGLNLWDKRHPSAARIAVQQVEAAARVKAADATAAAEIEKAARGMVGALNNRVAGLEASQVLADKKISDLTISLASANTQIAELTKGKVEQDLLVEDLRHGVSVLASQLHEAHIEPRYTPPPKKPKTGPLGKGA